MIMNHFITEHWDEFEKQRNAEPCTQALPQHAFTTNVHSTFVLRQFIICQPSASVSFITLFAGLTPERDDTVRLLTFQSLLPFQETIKGQTLITISVKPHVKLFASLMSNIFAFTCQTSCQTSCQTTRIEPLLKGQQQ